MLRFTGILTGMSLAVHGGHWNSMRGGTWAPSYAPSSAPTYLPGNVWWQLRAPDADYWRVYEAQFFTGSCDDESTRLDVSHWWEPTGVNNYWHGDWKADPRHDKPFEWSYHSGHVFDNDFDTHATREERWYPAESAAIGVYGEIDIKCVRVLQEGADVVLLEYRDEQGWGSDGYEVIGSFEVQDMQWSKFEVPGSSDLPDLRACEDETKWEENKRAKGRSTKSKTQTLCDCEDFCVSEGGFAVSYKAGKEKKKKTRPGACYCLLKLGRKGIKKKNADGFVLVALDS